MPRGRKNTPLDVLALVDRSGGRDACWPWRGHSVRGYGRVRFAGVHWRVHRLIAEWFVGPVDGRVVRHSCDNPPCCNPRHLLLGTHADNARDRMERGRAPRGRGHARPLRRLAEEDVHEIRAALAAGETQRSVAARYGMSQTGVAGIATGKRWAWLPTREEIAA